MSKKNRFFEPDSPFFKNIYTYIDMEKIKRGRTKKMKYIYNEERNRIACGANSPHFIKAIYEDLITHDQRALFLHTVSNMPKQQHTIATNFMNENEGLVSITEIPRRMYEKWLGKNEDFLTIKNEAVPISFVLDYLIADDVLKTGNLYRKRQLLSEKDASLLDDIRMSYDMAKEEKDVIREVPDMDL